MTELPELPMPDGAILARDGERATVFDGGYTADQMRAYALKERAAERERCAQICSDSAANLTSMSWFWPSAREAAEDLADSIRSQP